MIKPIKRKIYWVIDFSYLALHKEWYKVETYEDGRSYVYVKSLLGASGYLASDVLTMFTNHLCCQSMDEELAKELLSERKEIKKELDKLYLKERKKERITKSEWFK